MDKINAMSLEELEAQLPLAQNSLEAIELELEELMALRDANVIRVAAMVARLAALHQALEPRVSENQKRQSLSPRRKLLSWSGDM